MVLSIQAGKVLPSMLLQRLGVYSRKNNLYKAFSEFGRVERTMFLLEYMSGATMRQHIRAETTKVEAYHQFTDWIAFGGPVLRSGDPVEQEKRIKYRDLVANAVMLHNVVDMTNVLHDLQQRWIRITPEIAGVHESVSHGAHQTVWALHPGYGDASGTVTAQTALCDRPIKPAVTGFYTYSL